MTAIPYGEGTVANGGCDDCWRVPGRHCCLWHQYDNDAIHESYSYFAGQQCEPSAVEQSSAGAMVPTDWPGGRESNTTAGPLVDGEQVGQ